MNVMSIDILHDMSVKIITHPGHGSQETSPVALTN